MSGTKRLISERIVIEHCPARGKCPIGMLCTLGSSQEDDHPLFPLQLEVGKGEMLWTDLRYEQRVFIVRDGVFACIAHVDPYEREVPVALFGQGIAAGTAELYTEKRFADDYHLKAIVDGSVCSLPAKPLRKKMEMFHPAFPQTVLACALTNQAAATYMQVKIMSMPLLHDRILSLLLRLTSLAKEEGAADGAFALTHEDIASLVASDRVSVTRMLHRLRDEGLVELGYKSVALKGSLRDTGVETFEPVGIFSNVNEVFRRAESAQ